MSYSVKISAAVLALIFGTFLLGNACAQSPDGRSRAELPAKDRVAASGREARYVPPDLGAPEVRVSGGTRSAANGLSVSVLAPKQIGLTIQEQPTLYWYASRMSQAGMRLSIVADASSRTVLDMKISGAASAGIHAFPLKGTKVRLMPGTDYQWSVTAVTSDDPSGDVVSSGMIRRVLGHGPTVLASFQLTPDAPTEYAEAGLWYDALQALSEQIRMRPNDVSLRRQRGNLLNQVGLSDAAAWDLSLR